MARLDQAESQREGGGGGLLKGNGESGKAGYTFFGLGVSYGKWRRKMCRTLALPSGHVTLH